MIIYPAIDLRGGKVVRLREGDPQRQSVFSDDPVATAQAWIDQGAEWIHMVNLDGAFANANENLPILEAVAKLGVKLQFGGGLRDMGALRHAHEAGARRLVIHAGSTGTGSRGGGDRALRRRGDLRCPGREGGPGRHTWLDGTLGAYARGAGATTAGHGRCARPVHRCAARWRS